LHQLNDYVNISYLRQQKCQINQKIRCSTKLLFEILLHRMNGSSKQEAEADGQQQITAVAMAVIVTMMGRLVFN